MTLVITEHDFCHTFFLKTHVFKDCGVARKHKDEMHVSEKPFNTIPFDNN